jgi:excisionase family DNA binding protein
MSTLEIVLKHLIPALEAIRADLERERRTAAIPTPEPPPTPKPENLRDPSPKKYLLNIEEASERLSLSKATLYRYASERRIPFYKIWSRLLFAEEQLQEWVKQRRVDSF